MKKFAVLIALALIVIIGGIAFAYAEEGSGTSGRSTKSRERALAQCEKVESKFTDRSGKQEKLGKSHEQQYAQLSSRLTDLIARANAASYDTTQLVTLQAELTVKVNKFKTGKAAYQAALEKTKTYVCGSSEGDFEDALNAARTLQKQVRADVRDIHLFVKNQLKPAVRALKKATSDDASPTPSPSITPSASPSATSEA
jgi:hypothetical protein